ncbi:carbonic anhydrase family protein [Candidatus Sulfurimonas marisnigri]|uniref:Carbonic anhydrase n=1 Tax=Candidatus Sulfurimonas marisnigri TaxID=2740405 RepID=A0A7S7M363_9BACT|nr:carbonic anhydrase family protein [Candidatus Sulfurimonas marisnigri]QOY55729.1 carbonic anhydrase family protein [Candidatus Sulfurimonas marisnigri]
MKLSDVLKGGLVAAALSTTLLAGVHGTHWGYTGHEGPENWGNLDPKNFMCKDGRNQSPINIEERSIVTTTKGLDKIKFNYATEAENVVNNGHTIQVNVKSGSSINVDGIEFNLKQFHFHTPSENQIESKHFPLEAHFVHVSEDGQLAVVALMFEDGKENKKIKKIWDHMSEHAGETKGCGTHAVAPKDFLPSKKDYYRFDGSLTTPPCSEGVRWFVFQNYTYVNKEQVKKFAEIMGGKDNRPIQPINARKVLK